MAEPREMTISSLLTPLLSRPTTSVSAKTPHLAATWWTVLSWTVTRPASSWLMPILARILSMVAPVPPAHLSFM